MEPDNTTAVLISIGVFVFMMTLGLFVGGWTERRHLQSLRRREQDFSTLLVTQVKSFPLALPGNQPPMMVVAEVVIASDYLKSFLAKFRNLIGGEVKSFQTMLVRARREAILRILDQAREQGYDALCNVRLETADIGGNSAMSRVAMVAIIASGTAYHMSHSSR
jgi:uncharacterized protein YbjQ (UPF0145 family)